MTKLISKEDLADLRKRVDIVPPRDMIISRDMLDSLVFTIYQNRDALRVALDFVDKKGKERPDKGLTRAIIRETLGLPPEE